MSLNSLLLQKVQQVQWHLGLQIDPMERGGDDENVKYKLFT